MLAGGYCWTNIYLGVGDKWGMFKINCASRGGKVIVVVVVSVVVVVVGCLWWRSGGGGGGDSIYEGASFNGCRSPR